MSSDGKYNYRSTPAGAIDVYDANNQYLGILYELYGDKAKIYIPSMKKFIVLRFLDGNIMNSGTHANNYLLYESTDCSGQPHIGCIYGNSEFSACILHVIPDHSDSPQPNTTARYFITADSPLVERQFFSELYYGECRQDGYTRKSIVAIEVTLPFNTPVDFPLRFE